MFAFLRDTKNFNLRGRLTQLRRYSDKKIRIFLEESYIMREKLRDLARTNYALGLDHMRRGNLHDASLRFRIVLLLKPDFAAAHYNLARVMLMRNKFKQATDSFSMAQHFQPDYPEVDYMLACMQQDKSRVTAIPRSIIEEYFDDLAQHYNTESIHNNQYVGHHAIIDILADTLENNTIALDIADLGCGTGLCGSVARERLVVNSLTGVDISEKMLREARKLTHNGTVVYDYLKHQDMQVFLTRTERKYDIIIAALSFNYVGKLDELLIACKAALRPGGMLAFSTEESPSQDVMLNDSMRNFCHSLEYVRECAAHIGMQELSLKKTLLMENYLAVQCVLKKL